MSLVPGARLGSYVVESPLGAGGMGEVYRARDTALNRDVAIKVLPELFASDPERLARFSREAQTLASLNHPNIAAIYGVAETPGVRALVMELVAGEDLSAVIARGPLPLADTLPIATQIADALEAAHEQGIVHRDLKPANIKVRADGTVKVLDFGLAKAMDPGSSPGNPAHSPTLTARATQMGLVIGTAAYMAPEQARGKAVDRRADVWAFGVVLYEMLTGRRGFDGDDISITLAAVLKEDVDWRALPADLPPSIRRLLRRCLEKDPRKRLSSIADARLELEESSAGGPADAAPASAPARIPLWRRALPLAATAVVTALAVGWVMLLRRPAEPAPEIVRFAITGEPSAPLFHTPAIGDFALSRDGRTLVFLATRLGAPQIYARRLDQLSALPVPGGQPGHGPFLSPDGQWVGFFDSGTTTMTKVPLTGGTPLTVVRAKTVTSGAAWLEDGTIVYAVDGAGLFSVPEGGGEGTELTKLDASLGDTNHKWPSPIPHTRAILFTTASGDPLRTSRLAVLDRATGRIVRLPIAGTFPKYLKTGHIVYAQADGVLMAVPFDATRLQVTGTPIPLGERVGVKGSGVAGLDVSDSGQLVYSSLGNRNADRSLVWVGRDGHETPLPAPPRAYYYARVSPEGARLSLDIRDQDQDIWTWDPRGSLSRVTQGSGSEQYGLWTPDGQHIIYSSARDGKQSLYRARVDGAGTPELIVEAAGAFPNAVTADGKHLIFRSAVGTAGQNDLFIVALEGDHAVKPLLGTEHDELNAEISPNGRWMAFQSNLSGRSEIYVRPFPDVNASQKQVSIAGGVKPAWAPGGRELFYLTAEGKMMAVDVETARDFVPGTPAALFDASNYFAQSAGRNYDISKDGSRFIMVKNPVAIEGADTFAVILNWAAEVAARLPAR